MPDSAAVAARHKIKPGEPYPLGALYDGSGTNFALFSENAEKVELCLFDSADAKAERHRIPMPERTHLAWHVYLEGVKPGQLYGYRVHGRYAPAEGHRFNPNKVLLDPYARAIGRQLVWDDALFGYAIGDPQGDLAMDGRDSAAVAPLGVVTESRFDWGGDKPPRIPWNKTFIYELHVKGFTKKHPGVPEALRGTYQGLASEAPLRHLQELGVTAVELMPVHHVASERDLLARGLTNYWGYNTLGFFAPEPRYSSSGTDTGALTEFKAMVKALHAAGIEVILDVVYNHTAEGSQMGPTLSWRGIDNAAYYRLADDKRQYKDFTGCGNTLNMTHPRVLQLIMDSLRYWVLEMHVDGFRFDLASALARELHDVDRLGSFFDIIQQDPVLSQVKLIAEPWDVGEGGYQVGNFPVLWTEWNGKYRDCVRKYWKGDFCMLPELATRLAGSSDLYQLSGRSPWSSINFVTCHDGFSLHDLVSYNDKHNEANGEENRDGENNNHSWNSGAEGPSDDPEILALREGRKRDILATLFFSQGVPMLRAGDELSHTQNGNNNAYCHDDELSWLDWTLTPDKKKFLEFARRVVQLWKENPDFQRRRFLKGKALRAAGDKDVAWIAPGGHEMAEEDWKTPEGQCLGMLLAGDAIDELDEHGQHIVGDTFLVLLNASHLPVPFLLPGARTRARWERVLDTGEPEAPGGDPGPRGVYTMKPRSVTVLRAVRYEGQEGA